MKSILFFQTFDCSTVPISVNCTVNTIVVYSTTTQTFHTLKHTFLCGRFSGLHFAFSQQFTEILVIFFFLQRHLNTPFFPKLSFKRVLCMFLKLVHFLKADLDKH